MTSISTLVVGVPRSGTSATTNVLAHLGLDIGPESDLLPAALDNPRGYFERPEVIDFNDVVMARRGLTWDSVSFASVAPFTQAEVWQARQLITVDDAPLACVKDPRISILLPLWRSAFLDRIAVVVALRDPREVVWSMVVREGFTPVHAAALWISYLAHIAKESAGLPVEIIHFEDLVERPEDAVRSLADFLASNGAVDEVQGERIDLATTSIDPDLRRATYPDWLNDHPVVAESVRMHDDIRRTGSLDPVAEHLEAANRRIERLCDEVISMRRQSTSVAAKISDITSRLDPPLLLESNPADVEELDVAVAVEEPTNEVSLRSTRRGPGFFRTLQKLKGAFRPSAAASADDSTSARP